MQKFLNNSRERGVSFRRSKLSAGLPDWSGFILTSANHRLWTLRFNESDKLTPITFNYNSKSRFWEIDCFFCRVSCGALLHMLKREFVPCGEHRIQASPKWLFSGTGLINAETHTPEHCTVSFLNNPPMKASSHSEKPPFPCPPPLHSFF